MSPPNLEAQADDPVEWTENQRPKAIYRWLLWESALVALNVFMAWRNFLDGDIETVTFVFFALYFAARCLGFASALRGAPRATFAGWSHARFRFRGHEAAYRYTDIVAVKVKVALFRGGAMLMIVLRDGTEVQLYGLEPARCAVIQRVIQRQRRALRGGAAAPAAGSAGFGHALSLLPDGRRERDLTTSEGTAEGWPLGLGRWSYTDPDLLRAMVRLLCVGFFLIPVSILGAAGGDNGASWFFGLPIGLLISVLIYRLFHQQEQGARGDFWMDLPPTVHTSQGADELVKGASKAAGLPAPIRSDHKDGSSWRLEPGMKVAWHSTTWGEPNRLALSYSPATEMATAQRFKGALLATLDRPWPSEGPNALARVDESPPLATGSEWAKAMLPDGLEPVWDVSLPDDDPGLAPPGWWASSVRRPALASWRTSNTVSVAWMIGGMAGFAVVAGVVVGPGSPAGLALVVSGLLFVAIFALVWAGLELSEARGARLARRENARCYLRIDPGLQSANAIVEATGAAICVPWPWVRRLAAPRGALAYWSDSDEESEVVLWSGAGVGLPILELRSQRPADEVARLKGSILAGLYPDE